MRVFTCRVYVCMCVCACLLFLLYMSDVVCVCVYGYIIARGTGLGAVSQAGSIQLQIYYIIANIVTIYNKYSLD